MARFNWRACIFLFNYLFYYSSPTEEAAKAGYGNANGTVDLLMANSVVEKFGRLIPKSELSKADLKELSDASNKIFQRLNPPADKFVK